VMTSYSYATQELIAGLATPFAASALAVLRTSGEGAIEQIARCFSDPERLHSSGHGCLVHGVFQHPDSRRAIDDVVLGIYRAPGGYTGEDSVEIFCHGSLPGIQRILDALHAAGFRDALPGEFTYRAFLHGKIDLTQAEAVQEIVGSKSEKAHGFAMNRLSGKLSQVIDREKQRIIDIMSVLEVQLDYAEDEIEEDTAVPLDEITSAEEALTRLAETYGVGRLFHEGARIVIAGKTNAGKSSLFNLFLKQDRAIVSDVHGTTRDYLESWISIDGMPARLYDTAGFRYADPQGFPEIIEEEGIRRSWGVIEESDLVLYILDGTTGMNQEEKALFEGHREDPKYLFLWNKTDSDSAQPCPKGAFPVSAVTAEGFSKIEQSILTRLLGGNISSSDQEIMIDSLRQRELLRKAAASLQEAVQAVNSSMPVDIIASELQNAVSALGELTGEVTADDILDRIFSNFCVGK